VEPVSTLVALALIVEFATEAIKETIPYIRGNYSRLLAIAVGMLLCAVTKQGIMAIFSIPVTMPIVDYLVAGILISRGSNLLHDLFDRLRFQS